ncbi:methyltransferase [Corynebacterium heidelbergense]|uniref:Methyltransferase n=2 Tax=Corynebacterium heidelbergense TaxID=2055947 RepID=A0A364VEG1_9CORY|nr:methyltransferase [Corynebacterium heidelbergense]
MFMAWQRCVGGQLKSDLRFSNTLVWNTFPVPELTDKTRAAIVAGGKAVLTARAIHPERSLSDAYNPLGMDPALVKAHNTVDSAVDRAFGSSRRLTSEASRQELLFKNYSRLTSATA